MLRNKKYYKLIKDQLKKGNILENLEKSKGKMTHVMEIDLAEVPENIDQKADPDKGIYGFLASFDKSDVEFGIVLDVENLKPLSPFWINKQKKTDEKISKKDMEFFLKSLAENLEEGKAKFPIFVLYNDKNKFSVSPNIVDPLNILEK